MIRRLRSWMDRSLSRRVLSPLVAATVLATGAAWVFAVRHDTRQLERALAQRLETISGMIVYACDTADSPSQVERLIRSLGAERGMRGITVVSRPEAKILFSSVVIGTHTPALSEGDRQRIHALLSAAATERRLLYYRAEDQSLVMAAAMTLSGIGRALIGEEGGVVLVALDARPLRAEIHAVAQQYAAVGLLLAVVIAGSAYGLIRRFVLRPVGILSTAMRQREAGAGAAAVTIDSPDEMGALAQSFNDMVLALDRAQEAQRHARDVAERAARVKAEFLANMSHEIRTPMNGVLGMLTLLQDTPLNAEQRETAEIAQRSGQTLLALINDVLDLSKLEAGKVVIESIPLDPEALAEEVLTAIWPVAAPKGLELLTDVAAEVPTNCFGDPVRLRQILTNLCGNAVKFTDRGHVTIRVRYDAARGRVRFEVVDTGIGMSAEAMARLFQPFEQADSSTTRRFGGTGLGLAISKQLVELMGGAIGVEATVGQGSCFWIELPLQRMVPNVAARPRRSLTVAVAIEKPVLNEAVCRVLAREGHRALSLRLPATASDAEGVERFDVMVIATEVESPSSSAIDDRLATLACPVVALGTHGAPAVEGRRVATIARPLRRRTLARAIEQLIGEAIPPPPTAITNRRAAPGGAHLLVVDDNEINRRVAQRMLEKAGYRVSIAVDGVAALQKMSETSFDMVLMDCQMPQLDGYQATTLWRERESTARRLPIVALTAHALPGEREKCLAAGMDDYLTKPLDRAALTAMLERYLQVTASCSVAGGLPPPDQRVGQQQQSPASHDPQ